MAAPPQGAMARAARPRTQRRPLMLAMASSALLAVLTSRRGSLPCFAGGAPGQRLMWRAVPGRAHSSLGARGGAVGEAQPVSDAKAALMELVKDGDTLEEVLRTEGKPTRGRINEAILKLERLSPTVDPVYSEMLDGTWNILYTGTFAPGLLSSPTRELALFLYGGGFSLGNALSSFAAGPWGGGAVVGGKTVSTAAASSLGNALSSFAAGPWGGGAVVGGKTVKISGDGRIVKALLDLELAGFKQKLSYSAELMPLSGMRMSEEVLNVRLPEPLGDQILPFSLRRSILITYLDEDIMIVRDESGVPEVLKRELVPVVPAVVTFSRSNTIANSISDVQPPNATAFGVANAATTGAANATTSKKSTTSKK
eukprot:CAMPEP_0204092996 /NCGR_PEP_ID=MMETSP0360-20130528/190198_1 /ASSEMBLY_ACC=CAM_ASM_000342 /TAXON_ID=268821 /ORGANISM="Scrippsiella Hangoei, Strain SHTV-5" /LENGTH=368 /DNA_ID=CAMNT_0051042287 /DNA_START=37 /DNA_END=1142 /DNA_ORIENTATION=+